MKKKILSLFILTVLLLTFLSSCAEACNFKVILKCSSLEMKVGESEGLSTDTYSYDTRFSPNGKYPLGQSVNISFEELRAMEIVWESSDNSVATVENGIVTAVGVGEAVISATIENWEPTTCTVRVVE